MCKSDCLELINYHILYYTFIVKKKCYNLKDNQLSGSADLHDTIKNQTGSAFQCQLKGQLDSFEMSVRILHLWETLKPGKTASSKLCTLYIIY
jgi:hypothetical protein